MGWNGCQAVEHPYAMLAKTAFSKSSVVAVVVVTAGDDYCGYGSGYVVAAGTLKYQNWDSP